MGMIYFFSAPKHEGEQDLLVGFEHEDLKLVNTDDDSVVSLIPAPAEGWTHLALEEYAEVDICPVDAFLGTQFVGSTEC